MSGLLVHTNGPEVEADRGSQRIRVSAVYRGAPVELDLTTPEAMRLASELLVAIDRAEQGNENA
jgi:hypothetical protein